MELRVFLAVVCTVAFLFCSVSAAGISYEIPYSEDPRIQDFRSPNSPLRGGSILQRKALDSQPFIYKTSDRLLHEAEISRDIAQRNGMKR